jgi:hypothetical protein
MSLKKSGVLRDGKTIIWHSPLATEDYTEYRDKVALKKLGIERNLEFPLADIWPQRGAVCWYSGDSLLNSQGVSLSLMLPGSRQAEPGGILACAK